MGQLQRIVVTPNQMQADVIHLNPAQVHYLRRVLRLKLGESFIVMDGQGQTWRAEWRDDDRPTIHEVLVVASELPLPVTLAIALPKHGFDDVIRQVTELGVSWIVPIISDRTLLNPSQSKRDRWQKIIQEAAEQSERAIVPTILEPIDWLQYLQSPARQTMRLLAWERGDVPDLLTGLSTGLSASLFTGLSTGLPDRHDAIAVAIGPEGGWTDAEVAAAIAAGWQPISLGKRILRSVTASVAVMAIVAARLESAGNS